MNKNTYDAMSLIINELQYRMQQNMYSSVHNDDEYSVLEMAKTLYSLDKLIDLMDESLVNNIQGYENQLSIQEEELNKSRDLVWEYREEVKEYKELIENNKKNLEKKNKERLIEVTKLRKSEENMIRYLRIECGYTDDSIMRILQIDKKRYKYVIKKLINNNWEVKIDI